MKKKLVREYWPYETASMADENTDVRDIVQYFVQNPCVHHVCVVDSDRKLLGLINRKRMFKSVFSHYVEAESRISSLFKLLTAEKSTEIMLTNVISTTENASIDSVIKTLIERNFREMPVIDEDRHVLGFITIVRIMEEWVNEKTE